MESKNKERVINSKTTKTSAIRFRLEESTKKAFKNWCAEKGVQMTDVLTNFIETKISLETKNN